MGEIKFKTVEPKILYFETPVALITTVDENGSANISPMSSTIVNSLSLSRSTTGLKQSLFIIDHSNFPFSLW